MKRMMNGLKKFFSLFVPGCRVCAELRAQNEYLRRLVDHTLASKGVAPVGFIPISGENKEEKDPEEEELEKLRAGGALIYGGDKD